MSTQTPQKLRTSRLAKINFALRERNLKPLTDLGDHTHGQIELTTIHQIFAHSYRFFTDVQFDCIFPNGSKGLYAIRWNANSAVADGAVMVVVINGKLAFVRQFRSPLCGWSTELPRGFAEAMDKAKSQGTLGELHVADLPVATALRELGEEVIEGAEIVSVNCLGSVAQDSSTQTAMPAYWVIEVKVDPQELKQRLAEYTDEGIALQLMSYDSAMAAIGTKISDAHSIVGLALYRNFREGKLSSK